MNKTELAQAILDLSAEDMKAVYDRFLKDVKISRHAYCELQFQQILAAIIDPDGPIDLDYTISLFAHPTEDDSWNDRREVDGAWH